MPPIVNTQALKDARPTRKRMQPTEPEKPRLQVPEKAPSTPRSPAIPEPPKPQSAAIASTQERNDYDTVAVNNEQTPIRNLTPYIEGYEAWAVTYYGQILGRDDNPKPFSIDMSPVNQQYTRIEGMELKVSDPLSYAYINESQTERFSGRAYVQGNTIVPQRHDIFVAPVGRGMEMLFSIERVTPMSVMQETVYEVEYSSTDQYNDQNKPYLNAKVVSDLTYSRELLLQGRRALINNSQATTLKELKEHGNKLIRMYIEDFATGNRHRYLALPDQDGVYLDIYVQDTWYDMLDVTDYPELRRMNWVHLDQIPEAQVPTIWDAMLRKNDIKTKGVKYRMTKEMYTIETCDFILAHNNPMLGGIYYTGLDALVLPKMDGVKRRSMLELKPSIPRIDELKETLNPGTKLDPKDLTDRLKGRVPDIYPVQHDGHYVLSRHFYNEETENQSALELLVSDYLQDKAIDSRVLARLCEQAYNWGSLERYYYTLILLILIDHRLNIN